MESTSANDGYRSGTNAVLPVGLTARQIADWCHPTATSGRWPDSAPTADADTQGLPSHLLGIWAHPDDEAYLSAGLMARTVAAGGQVTLLTLTDGEAGFPEEDPRPASERALQRRFELQEAMAVIGVYDVRFLAIPDGELADAPAGALADQLADVITEVCPDVIVTFGPDGITGHPDHIANSKVVTRAWAETRIGDLWYAAKTDAWLDEWRDLHDRFGVWMTGEPTGVRDDEIEMIVDLAGSELDTKRAVLAAHRSQTQALSEAFGEDPYRKWICQETFRRPSQQELSAGLSLVGSAAS